MTFDYRLRPVAITASRYARPVYQVPFAVDYLSADDLQLGLLNHSMEEILRHLPGVLVNNRHNDSQGDRLTIRGIGSRAAFGVRGVKIVLDGIPLTLADGQSQLNNLDLGSVGRMEVLRGPSSSLYGNAAGGVLIVNTLDATSPGLSLRPQLILGSFGQRTLRGDLSYRKGQLSHFASIGHSRADGFRDHADAKRTHFNWISRFPMNPTLDVTTVINYLNAPYLLNPSSLSKADAKTRPTHARSFVQGQGASKRIRQLQGGLTLRKHLGNTDVMETTLFGLSRTLYNPIPGRIIDLSRTGFGLRSLLSKQMAVNAQMLRLTAGLDFESQNDERQEFENEGLAASAEPAAAGEILDQVVKGQRLMHQDEQVIAVGPFLEAGLSLFERWIVTAGARYDRFRFTADDFLLSDGDNSGKIEMSKFSPMVGLTFQARPNLALYTHYATSFQTPTTTELTNRPDAEGGLNTDLHPEVLRSVEIGLKGNVPLWRLLFDLSLFHYRIKDMLIPYQVSQSEEVFFRNAGQSRNTGLELKAEWFPSPGLRAIVSYTFMDFVFHDFRVAGGNGLLQLQDNKVPGVPRGHLYTGLFYGHHKGLYGEVNLQYVGGYYANDLNGPNPGSAGDSDAFKNDPYWTLDLRFGLRRLTRPVGIDIFFGINNILDERYNGSITPNAFGSRFFEPAPGRSGYVGLGFPLR